MGCVHSAGHTGGVRIDLHTHSTASDGTTSPADVVREAAAAGLDVVALTDHDTTAGWEEAITAAGEHAVAVVRGTEITCRGAGTTVHLLSYLHDPTEPVLAGVLERSRGARVSRAQRMAELIGRDFPLTWSDVLDHTPEGATVGRPHLADALVTLGVARDREEAFARILYSGGPNSVPYDVPRPRDAVTLVLAAGGVPVLAHPAAGRRGAILSDEQIAELAAAGLVGLEVDHRDHDDAERARLLGLARDLDLLVTGSSDYHGAGKPNRLGEHTTHPDVLESIHERGRLPLVR